VRMELAATKSSMDDIDHAPKLLALRFEHLHQNPFVRCAHQLTTDTSFEPVIC
jgi:hypothetical protein